MQREGIKQFFAFAGMLIYINMLFGVTTLLQMYPGKIDYEEDARTGATFIWLTVEWLTFLAIIISNILFLAFRSCFHHKIQLDKVPERKQLPNIDTIIAVQEVANAFNSMWVPTIISVVLYMQKDGTN